MKIKFKASKYRKRPIKHDFDYKLSRYWQRQFYDLFRRWH